MCQAYPRGRCSADARKRLSKVQAAFNKASEVFHSDPSAKNQRAFENARADLIQAQISFAGTKRGSERAEAQIKAAKNAKDVKNVSATLVAGKELRDALSNAADKLSAKYLTAIPEGDAEGRKAYDNYAKSLMHYQECTHAAKVAPELSHVFDKRIADLKKEAGANYEVLKAAYEKANSEPTVVAPAPEPALRVESAPEALAPAQAAPKPAPLPANPLLENVASAKNHLDQCKKNFDEANDVTAKQHADTALQSARAAYQTALVEYASTPEGEASALRTISALRAQGRPTVHHEELLRRGRARRREKQRSGVHGSRFPRRSSLDGMLINSNVPAVANKRVVMSGHVLDVAREKGFSEDAMRKTFSQPAEVYPSGSHPGQWRVTGNGLCLVGRPEGGTFQVITVYLDRVITAPRPDQLTEEKGRVFAEHYAQGRGRGRG